MSARDARRVHYFADYEGYCDGRAVLWGQLTHTLELPADADLDADALLSALRQRAAACHGLEAGQIRLCHVVKL